jgi:hypothetical protein
MTKSAWWPTQKWWASTIIGAVGMAVMLLTGDRSTISDPEIIALATFVTQRVGAWVVPNTASDGAHAMAYAQRKDRP